MSGPHTVRRVFGAVGVVAVLVLPSCGAGVMRRPATEVALTPLPAGRAMLTAPPDRGGIKLFDPITSYTIAKHAPKVEYAAYPVTYSADWTHWGTGCLHSNGRIYTAVGDHRGTNADTYLYELDPSARRLRRLVGLRESVKDFKWGDYGFGKVHGRICEGNDHKLYFASWWGPDADSPRYHGDRILCYDPSSGELADLGITVPGHGAPTTALDPSRLIFYGEFQHPTVEKTDFVAYDLKERTILFRGGHEGESDPGRGIVVDGSGCAYYGCDGTVRRYDPATNSVSDLPDRLPHDRIRQHASRPRPDGAIFATTRGGHSALVLLNGRAGKVTQVATLWSEIKALDADATGRWVYYLPDCQIGAASSGEIPPEFKDTKNLTAGLPLVQVDMANGASQKVIAFLEIPLHRAIGWEIRGRFTCYGLLVSEDGRTLYINLNGFRQCDLGFYHATPLLVVVHVPPEELPPAPDERKATGGRP